MKLTNDSLKKLILEVMSEATQETEYKRIMNMLQGGVESVDQMAILTPENPKAQPLSPQQNAARAEEFEKELAAAGYGFRIVSGMYEGPEDSYLVPHMTLDDAKRFAYKYGQESFIHSSRDGEGMKHSLEYPDYGAEVVDPSYDEETYGKILEVPPQVQIASSTPADSVLGHGDMASASDYYSHVPDKSWDEKVKDGKLRPAGRKLVSVSQLTSTSINRQPLAMIQKMIFAILDMFERQSTSSSTKQMFQTQSRLANLSRPFRLYLSKLLSQKHLVPQDTMLE